MWWGGAGGGAGGGGGGGGRGGGGGGGGGAGGFGPTSPGTPGIPGGGGGGGGTKASSRDILSGVLASLDRRSSPDGQDGELCEIGDGGRGSGGDGEDGAGGGGGVAELGRAVQVDPMNPRLKPPGTERLKVQWDMLLSYSAFKFYLRCYSWAPRACGTFWPVATQRCGSPNSVPVLAMSYTPQCTGACRGPTDHALHVFRLS